MTQNILIPLDHPYDASLNALSPLSETDPLSLLALALGEALALEATAVHLVSADAALGDMALQFTTDFLRQAKHPNGPLQCEVSLSHYPDLGRDAAILAAHQDLGTHALLLLDPMMQYLEGDLLALTPFVESAGHIRQRRSLVLAAYVTWQEALRFAPLHCLAGEYLRASGSHLVANDAQSATLSGPVQDLVPIAPAAVDGAADLPILVYGGRMMLRAQPGPLPAACGAWSGAYLLPGEVLMQYVTLSQGSAKLRLSTLAPLDCSLRANWPKLLAAHGLATAARAANLPAAAPGAVPVAVPLTTPVAASRKTPSRQRPSHAAMSKPVAKAG